MFCLLLTSCVHLLNDLHVMQRERLQQIVRKRFQSSKNPCLRLELKGAFIVFYLFFTGRLEREKSRQFFSLRCSLFVVTHRLASLYWDGHYRSLTGGFRIFSLTCFENSSVLCVPSDCSGSGRLLIFTVSVYSGGMYWKGGNFWRHPPTNTIKPMILSRHLPFVASFCCCCCWSLKLWRR